MYRMLHLLKKVFTSANKNVSKVLDTESKEMALWKVQCEHILAVNTSDGNNTQTRYFLLLKWEIALLAKTSHSVYKEIAQVIHLPILSYVLRKTKDLVGSQCVKKMCAVNLSMVETMNEK